MQLELDAVACRFDVQRVLESLSFALDSGEIGCLLGPSGCGKTTALRCIAGFEPIEAGTIRAGGVLLSGPGTHLPPERRRIGMVFQDLALFPHLDVRDNVAFGLHALARPARRARTEEMLRTVGLGGLAGRFPHELSGGQQQRVALARALAPHPRLLLLDEPLSSLDVDLRAQLGGELREILKQQQATALLVTHDQHEAFALADRVGVMHAGRVLQWDTPYALYHRPASRFVADFIGQGAFVEGVVETAGQVRTELGLATGAPTHVYPVGTRVDLLLRPDDVVHDDASALKAEVSCKAFRGAEFLSTLRLPSGASVLSLVPSHHNHAVGERIGIRLETDHVVCFPRE